ncbi:hypothetical protein AVEN_95244-1 [Araneus ventricosus]|uniref:Uncharacterized protein n=1 Tax=Araneus ventricosus TaxID=182803 RepID=A0A4Y2DHK1_ARAVE|nr:hypothetical protein AVEN_95244-1 [Araneus ventricosus]
MAVLRGEGCLFSNNPEEGLKFPTLEEKGLYLEGSICDRYCEKAEIPGTGAAEWGSENSNTKSTSWHHRSLYSRPGFSTKFNFMVGPGEEGIRTGGEKFLYFSP